MAGNKNRAQDLPVHVNPIDALNQEIERLRQAPDFVGCLEKRSMNEWVDDSITKTPPRTFCRGLIVELEVTVVFASAGLGKTVACVGMAEEIALETDEEVDYLDFELSEMHLRNRYYDEASQVKHVFPEKLNRFEYSPDRLGDDDVEDAILKSIILEAQRGVKYFVVDNITYICRDSEKGTSASDFMKILRILCKEHQLTMIIVAHTPKRDMRSPITEYDLAGSSKLINFFDAAIAIGKSVKDSATRYMKQVKTRTGAELYGSDNVLVYRIVQTDGYTHFEFQDFGRERDHLRENSAETEMDEIHTCARLCKQNMTVRKISAETGIKITTVQRRLEKARNLGLLPKKDVSSVSPEWEEQEEQPGTPSLMNEEDDDE